jgi:hypothetical protein
VATAVRYAGPRLREALHGARAPGGTRLRFRFPSQGVVALLAAGLLPGCSTLASEGALVVCQAADAATTLEGVERGAKELNPVVDYLLAALGPAGFVAAKAGVTLVVLKHYDEISQGLLAAVNGVTCIAAAHNAYVIHKLPPKPKDAP